MWLESIYAALLSLTALSEARPEKDLLIFIAVTIALPLPPLFLEIYKTLFLTQKVQKNNVQNFQI